MKVQAYDSLNNKMLSWNELGWMEMNGEISIHSLISGEYEHFKPLRYTGLQDIKGNDIYEMNITEVKYNNPLTGGVAVDRYKIETQENTLIKMAHSSGEPRWDRYLHMQYKECEVIGNIYEHPHLLEVEKS